MQEIILLKDIISILPELVDIYYKYSYIDKYTKRELKESPWLDEKVSLVIGEDDYTSVYLTDKNRSF
ncbi:hypothetical protein H8J86_08250 [Clostridium perfringens]|uniref:hypothetical protein n=1 Tax=Clostridium perfringens TaxID=1502 RepID=UPI0018E40699|nr:hypothetical protein [Clostridium perfringens]MBI6005944.1 hypothetical protein [Clostridium perfringens]MDK0621696.1 hypothetical protein [Clostridium perfringens]